VGATNKEMAARPCCCARSRRSRASATSGSPSAGQAIIYLRKHESPATAPSSEGNAQDGLTQKVSSLLFPYLRAWTDQAEIGDPAFDECATVESLADLLAARVVRLLRTEI